MRNGSKLALGLVAATLLLAAVSSASAAGSGSLTVHVIGLPPGQAPSGLLRGPGGLRRRVASASVRIAHAKPGRYVLTLKPVRIAHARSPIRSGAIAKPFHVSVSARVRPGKSANLPGSYGSIINPGILSITGGIASLTGSPENPTTVTFQGRKHFARGTILSIPPSLSLPRGLLAHVVSSTARGGDTVLSVTPASPYEVAPALQYEVPLTSAQASAAGLSAGCGSASGVAPYRRIKDITFSGGWNTMPWIHIPVGVKAAVHFTAETGLDVTGGLGISCSAQASISANGMAGPVPVTAAIQGELNASAAAGGVLSAGGSLRIDAGASTVGVPPALLWAPDVAFSNPHFTLSAKTFAQATAGIAIAVKLGIGNDNLASATLNVGNSVDFDAHPGSCEWAARFGQFSAEGKLLKWDIQTPKTPALFTKQLWHQACGSSSGGPGSPPPASPPPSGPPPGPGWSLQPLPGTSSTNSSLVGISCVGTTWCLSVGSSDMATLTEIWNGSSWSDQTTANVGFLGAVSCLSTSWCMAVGNESAAIWHGTSWEPVSLPAIAGAQSTDFLSLACTSTSSCIAVGQANGSEGSSTPISARWNGSTWSLLTTPQPPSTDDTDLVSVSCPAENVCTAVGGYNDDQGILTGHAYAERWDGSSWTVQSTPTPGVFSGLSSVSCPTTTTCVAVGYWDGGFGTQARPLAEQWTGSTWSSTGAVLPAGAEGGETAYVSCVSAMSCEAVGQDYVPPSQVTLAERWDGSFWTVQSSPNPSGSSDSVFQGIACTSATTCLASGASFLTGGGGRAFSESYSG